MAAAAAATVAAVRTRRGGRDAARRHLRASVRTASTGMSLFDVATSKTSPAVIWCLSTVSGRGSKTSSVNISAESNLPQATEAATSRAMARRSASRNRRDGVPKNTLCCVLLGSPTCASRFAYSKPCSS